MADERRYTPKGLPVVSKEVIDSFKKEKSVGGRAQYGISGEELAQIILDDLERLKEGKTPA